MHSPDRTIYGLFFAVALYLIIITIFDSPREELETEYASVEEIAWSSAPLKCRSTNKRHTYFFVATTHEGKKATGYICHTPGPFAVIDSQIHEDK